MDEADALDAVNDRLAAAYPGQEPRHWGTVRRYAEGGPDPLDGVSAYAATDPPHWHYVSFGLAPWGFELSFRVARGWEAEPPFWPVSFLQQLARYVNNTGEPFGHGHYIRWGGPITNAEPTDHVALVFTADPALGSVPVGGERLELLCPLGITDAEYGACARDRPEDVLRMLLSASPLGMVDLRRSAAG
jgi:suppressor of fused-like protein